MKRTFKAVSLILSVMMILSMIPSTVITAFAEGLYDGEISGVIKDEEGNGITGVSVFVFDLSENELVDYFKTSSGGNWSTNESVSGNKYLVTYYHRDYTLSDDTFMVEAAAGTQSVRNITEATLT